MIRSSGAHVKQSAPSRALRSLDFPAIVVLNCVDMGFLSNLFGDQDKPIENYTDFWAWFSQNQSAFHKVIRSKDTEKISKEVFGPLGEKLVQIKDGFFFLAGMLDDSTVDLVFTADGDPKNIVFVEELVAAAPELSGWQFTPLKQPVNSFGLRMNGVEFGEQSLSFYPIEHEDMPDLVDITLVHPALAGASTESAKHGAYIFLDNFLGELNFLTRIDDLNYSTPSDAARKCIPIEALPNYLETREALFIEKYHGVRIFTDEDSYSGLEAEIDNGLPWLAIVNSDLLKWDKKASHPWMLVVTIFYKGENNGLPDSAEYDQLNEIEDSISDVLKDADGYLNIGRQTGNNERLIFFACAEFRKPSKVAYEVQQRYKNLFAIEYDLFKDKYWQSVSHFSPRPD